MDGELHWLLGSRLKRQQLRPPQAGTVQDALKNLLAVQAQEFAYARWSLAQRSTGVKQQSGGLAAEVEQAMVEGSILRTHILRPTWHFVHRDDLGWLMALSAPRLHQGNKGMYRQTGLDAGVAARSGEVLASAVAGGAHKTREELAEALGQAGLPSKGLGFIYLLMHAEISGILVSGAPLRSAGGALKQTYASFPERLAPHAADGVGREEALARLVLRYFRSRGPATVKDCAAWSGMTMRDIREGLKLAAGLSPGALASFTREGLEFHLAAEDLDAVASAADVVPAADSPGAASPAAADAQAGAKIDLIQCYDEYVMGYSQTRNHLGGTAPYFASADSPMHVVLLDGRLAGWWRHTFSSAGCELDVRMDRAPDAAVLTALETEAGRYGSFLGMPAKLVPAPR